jgi:hypothetical protein
MQRARLPARILLHVVVLLQSSHCYLATVMLQVLPEVQQATSPARTPLQGARPVLPQERGCA